MTRQLVERMIARLHAAGLPADVEREEVCCYAKQTKVWSTEPDGRRWETYYVIEDTQERDDPQCCADVASEKSLGATC